ncbi:MAG: BMP family ABC transporter substrate-binding protein [Faecousia sp.]
MKKLLAMILAAVMVLSMAACGAKSTAETPAAAPAATQAPAAGETAKAEATEELTTFGKPASEVGVVLILNTQRGDHAICDLSYEGLMDVAEKYGCKTAVVELQGDPTLQVPTMQEYAEDPDFDLIVCGTSNLKEAAQTVAQEYPEQKFILYDAKDELALPNVYSMDHAQNEGAYLAGVAAALLTTSDAPLANADKTVGFVGGGENTALDDYLIGYIQGVHSVDEDINILVSWIGDFKDTAKGKELAIAQANQGADVIFSVAGGAGLGILAGCAESNVYAVGVDSDQYTVLTEAGDTEIAANICTSMYKKANVTVSTLVGMAMDGTLDWGGYIKWGLSMGVVGLATDNDNYKTIFTQDMQAKIAQVQEDAVAGKLEIKSAIGMENDELQAILATASK